MVISPYGMLWVQLSIFCMVKNHLHFFSYYLSVHIFIPLSRGLWTFSPIFRSSFYVRNINPLSEKLQILFKTHIFIETWRNWVNVARSYGNWEDTATGEGVFMCLLRGLWGWSRVLTRKNRLWIMYNIVGNWELILKFEEEVEAGDINLETANTEMMCKAWSFNSLE